MIAESEDLVFVDTNVLLYRLDSTDRTKQVLATAWLQALWAHNAGRLSWQVLNEYYASAIRKFNAPAERIRASVQTYSEWRPLGQSLGLVQHAWRWVDAAGINYWDALILAAAEQSDCRWLLSEDFQEKRSFGSIRIVNPFHESPSDLGFAPDSPRQ